MVFLGSGKFWFFLFSRGFYVLFLWFFRFCIINLSFCHDIVCVFRLVYWNFALESESVLQASRWLGHIVALFFKFFICNFSSFYLLFQMSSLHCWMEVGYYYLENRLILHHLRINFVLLKNSICHVHFSLVLAHELQLHIWFFYDILK